MNPSLFEKVVAMIPLAIDQLADLREECMRSGPLKSTLWTFPWDTKILVEDTELFLREIVNSFEFREYLGSLLGHEGYYTVTIHTLDHDCRIAFSDGEAKVDSNNAVLIATFTPSCDDCGKKVVNGRMTCVCWADEEDYALHRY